VGNDASAAGTSSKKIRILLLTQGSPFFVPIARGVLDGGGKSSRFSTQHATPSAGDGSGSDFS
jgi:hypothetical protein